MGVKIYNSKEDTYTELFTGAVLDTFERNGYDDSDFLAVVWNGEKVTTYEYGTTRFWTYKNSASVDATAEVIEKAEGWLADYIERALTARHYTAERNKTVHSLTTRGQAADVTGVVKATGERTSKYGTWSYGTRLGLKVEGHEKLVWVDSTRVEVVDAIDKAAVREEAERLAKGHNFRSAVWS